ncbi:E3 SUMO-protein ligase ZBED1-like [Paramisgurnus dabryanus]|uniref:E3 SUMO-protein ligase ZBED1-like n=1 Tax=Paramisgurnus dabryanus TaxID=90735 RepID=UPI0031F40D60
MSGIRKSKVWMHFEMVKDDPKKVKCKLCQQLMSYHSSTTNMAFHLKRIHPQYQTDDGSSSSTGAAPKLTQRKLDLRPPLSEKRKRDITDKIAEFIALDMRPVNVVEGEGFKELMRTLEPGYTVPKRETVMHALDAKYASIRTEVYASINNCKAISLTTDIWTSLQMEAYLTVTAHFITEDWRLENFVLATKKMEESHTAEHISQTLKEVISDWDIPGTKIVSVVHDNATNMVACTNQLAQDPSWGNVQGVRCAGHTLQLCINSALKKDPVCRTVAAARRLVSHFKKSAKATTALAEKQRELNVAEHKLVQDVATRWNSVYLMLDRLLEQRGAVSAVLTDSSVSKRSDRDLELTTSQWRMAEDIVNVLKPMIKLTELLSQDMNTSLSATVPMLMNIKKRHLVVHEDDSTVTKTLKIILTEEIDRRWDLKGRLLESSIYIKAAILDPRFKKLSFFTDDEQRNEAYTVVENLAESLSARPVQEVGDDSELVEERDTAGTSRQEKEKDQVLSMLLSSDEEEQQPGDSEMRAYLKDTTKSSTGPLEWWQKNEERYPKLSRVAKMFHSIPSTSHLLSKAGFIISKTRSALLPANVNKLVFLAHNIKRLKRTQAE